MIKRMICLSLVLILVMGLIPAMASAEEPEIGLRLLGEGESYTNMFVSRNMLDMIKDVEGFSATPYWDVSQWTIGYGTACGYKWNDKPDMTVSREEAEKMLLLDVSDKYGRIVNEYCASIGRQPNQQQFDALVDFTYNLGGNWTRGCMLTDWLENPTTELDFVNAIGRWGRISSKVNYATCMRRIREAIVFLKGEYYLTYGGGSFETELEVLSNHNLPYYRAVIYMCEGGAIDGLSDDVSYHFVGDSYAQLPDPVREGREFVGWQVVQEQASNVSEPYMLESDMIVEKNLRVIALWDPTDEEVGTEPTEPEVPETTVPEETEPEVPETTVPEETEPEVPETTVPEETEPEVPETTVPEDTEPEAIMGTVKTGALTVRTGPGAEYASVGLLTMGDRVAITEQKSDGTRLWGKTEAGWICLDYVLLDGSAEKDPEPEINVIVGIVKSGALTIRTGPASTFDSVGLLSKGDRVEITEQQSDGTRLWGKIDAGWICMDYIQLENDQEEDPEPTEPEETEPEEPEVPVTMVTVNTGALTVRSGPGSSYASVGLLSRGDRVAITEQQSDGTRMWGKTESGWICLDYVIFDGDGSAETEPDEPDETEPVVPEKQMNFEDVSETKWYWECVKFVYQNGYMNGVSTTRFGPDDSMTRAMLVTVLYRMAGEPEVAPELLGQFVDVEDSDYYAHAVAWAKANGIVNGVSATSFAPERKVSRQDAITIFHRYFVNYLHMEDHTSTDLNAFVDHKKVSSYAKNSVAWAVEAGIVSGSVTTEGSFLKPLDDLTRAQAAQLMYKLAELIKDAM